MTIEEFDASPGDPNGPLYQLEIAIDFTAVPCRPMRMYGGWQNLGEEGEDAHIEDMECTVTSALDDERAVGQEELALLQAALNLQLDAADGKLRESIEQDCMDHANDYHAERQWDRD